MGSRSKTGLRRDGHIAGLGSRKDGVQGLEGEVDAFGLGPKTEVPGDRQL